MGEWRTASQLAALSALSRRDVLSLLTLRRKQASIHPHACRLRCAPEVERVQLRKLAQHLGQRRDALRAKVVLPVRGAEGKP